MRPNGVREGAEVGAEAGVEAEAGMEAEVDPEADARARADLRRRPGLDLGEPTPLPLLPTLPLLLRPPRFGEAAPAGLDEGTLGVLRDVARAERGAFGLDDADPDADAEGSAGPGRPSKSSRLDVRLVCSGAGSGGL